MTSLNAKIRAQEQAGYSQALKSSAPEMTNLDKTYGDLATFQRSLNRPTSIPYNALTAGKTLGGAGLGYLLGGVPGAAAGAVMTSPAGMSTTGRAMIGTSKVLPVVGNQGLRYLLVKESEE
jgi:hypothetical protein